MTPRGWPKKPKAAIKALKKARDDIQAKVDAYRLAATNLHDGVDTDDDFYATDDDEGYKEEVEMAQESTSTAAPADPSSDASKDDKKSSKKNDSSTTTAIVIVIVLVVVFAIVGLVVVVVMKQRAAGPVQGKSFENPMYGQQVTQAASGMAPGSMGGAGGNPNALYADASGTAGYMDVAPKSNPAYGAQGNHGYMDMGGEDNDV